MCDVFNIYTAASRSLEHRAGRKRGNPRHWMVRRLEVWVLRWEGKERVGEKEGQNQSKGLKKRDVRLCGMWR